MANDDEITAQWPDFPYDPIALWLEVKKGDKVKYKAIAHAVFLTVDWDGKEFNWAEVPFNKIGARLGVVDGDTVIYEKIGPRLIGIAKKAEGTRKEAAEVLASAMTMRGEEGKAVSSKWPKIPLPRIAKWLRVSDGDKVKYGRFLQWAELTVPRPDDNQGVFSWPELPLEKVKADQKLEEGMNVGYSNAFGGRRVYIIHD